MKSPRLLLLLLAFVLPLQGLLAQEKHEFKQTVKLDGAKRAKIIMEMPAGVLNIKAGSAALAEFDIKYPRADWKPQFTQTTYNQTTELRLKQPKINNQGNSTKGENSWQLNLSKSTPLELDVTVGAGESKLNLQNSNVQKLTMSTGAGELNIDLRGSQMRDLVVSAGVGELVVDLRGSWNQDLKVDISSGIGDVKLLLPKSTGVRLRRSGLGSISASGLQKNGDSYSNQALGKSKHTITVNVSGGMGSLTISQE